MARPIIDKNECSACGSCVDVCPNGVLDIINDHATVVDEDSCVACGECMEECPMGAITDIDEE